MEQAEHNAKVTVTKKVAEAIEDVRKMYRDSEIIATIEIDRGCTAYGSKMPTLIKFTRQAEGNLDLIMQALVNGYEVEKSPEEKIREYYESLNDEFTYEPKERDGIEQTLNLLGIKIGGVNA